jgi:membrane protein implicated in regulation of membrane protease activity
MDNLNLVFWHWWILAALLMIVEVLLPGMFLLWISLAAFLVGGLCFLFPTLELSYQIFLFAVFAIASAWLGRSYLKCHPRPTDQPHLNRKADQYIGRQLTLDQPIINGYGKTKIDDSLWKISGGDCPAGTRVEVKGLVSGNILEVKILNSDSKPEDKINF